MDGPRAERGARHAAEAERYLSRFRRAWQWARITRAALLAAAVLLGGWALLAVVDHAWPLPAMLRSVLRFAPPAAAAAIVAVALVHAATAQRRRLALRAEEEHPELEAVLTTLLDAVPVGEVGDAFAARARSRLATLDGTAVIELRARRRLAAAAVAAAALVAIVLIAGPAASWQRWASPTAASAAAAPGARFGSGASDSRTAARIGDVRWTVMPPAYTGLAAESAAGGPIVALPGSRIRLEAGAPPAGTTLSAQLIGGAALAGGGAAGDDVGWLAEWTLRAGQRGVLLELLADGEVAARRVLPIVPREDRPPDVQLLEPAADLVVGSASGVVRLRASARDDFGVERFRLSWIHTSGSGESFSFRQGEWTWSAVRAASGVLIGEHALDLASTGMRPGDVLHIRAVAHDGNTVDGPGEGVSRTLVIRVARAEDAAQITTLIGFPLDADPDPVLSQRMLILMTERLRDRQPSLERAALLAESNRIGDEQSRLRDEVGEEIFVRTSAAEDDDESHDETAHVHDASPILSMNTLKLRAFNAMWAAVRELRQARPAAALPHQYEALGYIQQMREANRVFVRGSQRVAPIDVAALRGTGRIGDAAPSARSPAPARTAAAGAAAELETWLARLHHEPPGELSIALAGLSLQMLNDPAIDAAAAALVAAAADAVLRGDRTEAMTLALRARTALVGGAAAGSARPLPRAPSTASAAYLRRIRAARPQSPAAHAAPFVFATARYESGNWDSAPLVPTNLVHSLAQYTDIAVAAEGVYVDLASPLVFRYSFLFLTGHLPVRFTQAESRNLEAYVERGGFIFIDDHNHDIDGAFHRTVVAELTRIFGDASLVELPNDHELYRAFFHFENGPPTTAHELNGWGDGLIHEQLHAILVAGRIGVLYSNKDYASEWNYHADNKRFLGLDNTRFGVNIIVYALTR